MVSKLKIPSLVLDLNFSLYLFLKELNGSNGLNDKEIDILLQKYYVNTSDYTSIVDIFHNEISKIKKNEKRENLYLILLKIDTYDTFLLFIFALRLIRIKPLLLQEAKIIDSVSLVKSQKLHPLSIAYDSIGRYGAYYTRVNGALLSLLFFNKLENKNTNFLSDNAEVYLTDLIQEYTSIKKSGIEPNQIFMLMFSESINQSITSNAGSSYEDRIFDVLVALGISSTSINKVHDQADKSTEYDFFFTIKGRTYGIGAKRTLRERYKQFIKTALTSPIDVSIEITLGLDLTMEKAITIRKHHTYLFIADEIYASRVYLQEIDGVFPASQLTLDVLTGLK